MSQLQQQETRNMKTLFLFALLAVAFTITQVNTKEEEEIRGRRQTVEQCEEKVVQHQASLAAAVVQIQSSCTGNFCSSDCRSALNTIKNDIGCCFGKLSGDMAAVNAAYELCNLTPPGKCNSASGVFASIFVITLISVISYFMN